MSFLESALYCSVSFSMTLSLCLHLDNPVSEQDVITWVLN